MGNHFDIVVYDLEILIAATQEGYQPVGKTFKFPTWGGPELEDICKDIARRITLLRAQGWTDFRFAKDDAVSMTDFNRVATRVAQLTGGSGEDFNKKLN